MKNMDEIITKLGLENNISLDDVPDLDLYMDQVIQLFERQFTGAKRNEEEKVLTKTMINNYAKGKLFFPIKNKKYSKEHVLLISFIYQLKGALSIGDIKETLEKINEKVLDEEEPFSLEEFYKDYLDLTSDNALMFQENVSKVASEIDESNIREELKEVMLILSFAQMSNFYRRAAEIMVDELIKEKK